MAKLTSTPCGPIRLRDIKLSISGANSSGTSSCKTLNIKDCIVSFTFEMNEELSENSKNALLNTINIYLYSMPSVSYNNHLIFSLHLTNCESSVLDKINKQNTAHVNGKFTRETLIKSSHLCQTWSHWSQIVQSLVFKLCFVNKGSVRYIYIHNVKSNFIPYHANIISLGKPYDIYKNAVLSRNLIWSSSVFIIYYLDKPRFSLKAYTTDNCRQA